QALFLRARNFYELSQIYAMPYNPASASTDQGAVLRLESDVNVVPTRSTVKDTYDQVVKDLTDALPLLPDIPLYKTRPSRSAVFGMLARMYLSIEDYGKAAANADSVLKYQSSLLDWNTLDTSVSAASPIISYFPDEVIFYSLMNNNYAAATYNARVNPDVYN